MKNPQSGDLDEYQNEIANVTLAYSKNIKVKYAPKLDRLMIDIKKYELLLVTNPSKAGYCRPRIAKLQQKLFRMQQQMDKESFKA